MMVKYSFFLNIILRSTMVEIRITFTSAAFLITHKGVIKSMKEQPPEKCEYIILFDLDRESYRHNGKCRCTNRSFPRCKSCQSGNSFRTNKEINDIIQDIKETVSKKFWSMIDDIKAFFSACKGFANLLSSSYVVMNLRNKYFQVQKNSNIFSLDLGRIFESMIQYEGNSLSKAVEKCGLSKADIVQHVKMPTYSRSIFPDFADNFIRDKLLALSLSMKMLFRLVSLHHLNKNHRGQMFFMNKIAEFIFRMFIRKQMLK
jgi:hypothetical protein